MQACVKQAPEQVLHKLKKKQHLPFPSTIIIYGANTQYETEHSPAPLLDKEGKMFIQKVCSVTTEWKSTQYIGITFD